MATLSKDDVLDAISGMTVIELKELLDAFEEKFGVMIKYGGPEQTRQLFWRQTKT